MVCPLPQQPQSHSLLVALSAAATPQIKAQTPHSKSTHVHTPRCTSSLEPRPSTLDPPTPNR
eukprot:2891097-Rhodomonas_salina.2